MSGLARAGQRRSCESHTSVVEIGRVAHAAWTGLLLQARVHRLGQVVLRPVSQRASVVRQTCSC